MMIRTETVSDRKKVDALIKEAFKTARFYEGDEHEYMAELRETRDFIPELSIVAEENGEIVGQAVACKLTVTSDASDFTILLFGPISIRLDKRSLGLGGELIREIEKRALALGWGAMLLVGNPEYYGRHGYLKSAEYGITTNSYPKDVTLIKELIPGFLKGKSGTVRLYE